MKSKTDICRFSKAELLESKKFAERRDLLSALLDDKKKYTVSEAETKLNDFLKGEVRAWH